MEEITSIVYSVLLIGTWQASWTNMIAQIWDEVVNSIAQFVLCNYLIWEI